MAIRNALRRSKWRFQARDEQLPPQQEWRRAYLSGGRGSGKSWTASHWFADEILSDPERAEGEWAVVAPTFGDARDKCIESSQSGLIRAFGSTPEEVNAGRSELIETWNRSIGEMILRDGTKIVIDGADDGAYRIQGYNLRGVWADEIGLWKRWSTAWRESIMLALRLGRSRIVATGTPKRSLPARALIKELLEDESVLKRRYRTADNWGNLSESFREEVSRFIGTDLGAQELEGILLKANDGALWDYDWIEGHRVEELPYGGWETPPRIGVDLAGGKQGGDLHSYTVVGQHGHDHRLYVVEHDAMVVTPLAFAKRTVHVAQAHHGIIRLEINYGGAWAEQVFRQAQQEMRSDVPVQVIHATQSKLSRAEPVAALYERGLVSHVGEFAELEDQIVNYDGTGASPDRLDSLVHALAPFTSRRFGPPLPDHLDSAVPYAEQAVGTDSGGYVDGAVAWR